MAAGDDLVIDVDNGRAWVARTLRTEGVTVGRLFAEVDLARSLRRRHEILLTLVLVNGCLAVAIALGGYFGYFALKRMLSDGMANRPFLESLRHGTAGRLANVASCIVIGLLLVALFNLLSPSKPRHIPPSFISKTTDARPIKGVEIALDRGAQSARAWSACRRVR